MLVDNRPVPGRFRVTPGIEVPPLLAIRGHLLNLRHPRSITAVRSTTDGMRRARHPELTDPAVRSTVAEHS